LATSKPVKPHTPHPTPHTLPPPKNFFSRPYLSGQALMQEAKGGIILNPLSIGYISGQAMGNRQ